MPHRDCAVLPKAYDLKGAEIMDKKRILAAGGDIRMLYAAKELSKLSDKFDVEITGFSPEKVPDDEKEILKAFSDTGKETDILLLPHLVTDSKGRFNAPFSEKEIDISDLLKRVKKGGAVFLGIKGEKVIDAAKEKSLYHYKYMEDEILALANAVPTAEGAIKIIIEETGRTIWNSNILVTGYGKIGTVLTDRLIKMGANVTTAARKEYDRMRIKTSGGRAAGIKPGEDVLSEAEVTVNTVPARIFGEKEFSCMKKGSVYIELASAPFGADKKDAEKYNIKYVCASGLPAWEMGLHIIKMTLKVGKKGIKIY